MTGEEITLREYLEQAMADLTGRISQLDRMLQLQLQHMTTLSERSRLETERRLAGLEDRVHDVEEATQQYQDFQVSVKSQIRLLGVMLTVGLPLLMAAVELVLRRF